MFDSVLRYWGIVSRVHRAPKETMSEGAANEHHPDGTLRSAGGLLLVADDNEDSGDSLGSFAEILGLRVLVVRDGEAAVQVALREMPKIAILDLGMPKVDGWAACRLIRALPNGMDVRLVALSGWGSAEARARSAEAGFDAHWTKPAEAASLMRLLVGGECDTPWKG
jgi:CheY-like chemotaxis protein